MSAPPRVPTLRMRAVRTWSAVMSRQGARSWGLTASALARATASAKWPGLAPRRPGTARSSISATQTSNARPRRASTLRRPAEALPSTTGRAGLAAAGARLRLSSRDTGDKSWSDGDESLLALLAPAARRGGGDAAAAAALIDVVFRTRSREPQAGSTVDTGWCNETTQTQQRARARGSRPLRHRPLRRRSRVHAAVSKIHAANGVPGATPASTAPPRGAPRRRSCAARTPRATRAAGCRCCS